MTPSDSDSRHFTRLLNGIADGDERATDEVLPVIYGELRKLAAAQFAREVHVLTLQPTALVNEAPGFA